eukprot:5605281-Amphidinium_carterae.1
MPPKTPHKTSYSRQRSSYSRKTRPDLVALRVWATAKPQVPTIYLDLLGPLPVRELDLHEHRGQGRDQGASEHEAEKHPQRD